MSSQEHKENSIRFIDSGYNEKFRVNDGEKILIHTRNGTTLERECKYIDDYHTQIGSDVSISVNLQSCVKETVIPLNQPERKR